MPFVFQTAANLALPTGGGGGGTPAWFAAQANSAWSTPANNAAAIAANRHWVGASAVVDPLLSSNGGTGHYIVDDYCGMATEIIKKYVVLPGNGGHSDYFGNEGYYLGLHLDAPMWYRLRNATLQNGSGNIGRAWPSDGNPPPSHSYSQNVAVGNEVWRCGLSGVPYLGFGASQALWRLHIGDYTTTTPNTGPDIGTNFYHDHGDVLTGTASTGNSCSVFDPASNQVISLFGNSNTPSVQYFNPLTGAINHTNTNAISDGNVWSRGLDTTNRIVLVYSNTGSGIWFALNLGTVGSPTFGATYSVTASGTPPTVLAGMFWHVPSQAFLSWEPGTGLLVGTPTVVAGSYTHITWAVSGVTLTGGPPPAYINPADEGLNSRLDGIPDMGDGRACLLYLPQYQPQDMWCLALANSSY